jgi:protein-S-isoprenylcysteine O-methyltransferase Ste14
MDPFRLFFGVILIGAFAISATFRRRARRSETIARRREGGWMILMRLSLALPLFGLMAAYLLNPDWLAWSAISLPDEARWGGVVVGLAMLPVLYWVFSSIGRNVSETVLTKASHELVIAGPYRWVRHPLYSAATIAFLALGVVAANAVMLGLAAAMFVGIALLVVPKEEAHLVGKFGQAYESYRRSTGAFLPRPSPAAPAAPAAPLHDV